MEHFKTLTGADPSRDAKTARDDFYQMRASKFVGEFGWSLGLTNGRECDQYDRTDTLYCLAYDETRLMAGVRLLRTDKTHSGWSYMVNDANRGLLPNLAAGLLPNPPKSKTTYELSRLCAEPSLSRRQQNIWLGVLAHHAFGQLVQLGATDAIAMIDPRFLGWLRARGFDAEVHSRVEKFPQGEYAILCGKINAAQVAA